MAKAKFPGLQEKFENCLRIGFKEKPSVSMNEFLKIITSLSKDETTQISADEHADLQRNLSNYITRALDNEVIVSLGRKRGYRLVEKITETTGDNNDIEMQQIADYGTDISKESFLHFPATLLLSKSFNSRVFSQPSKSNSQPWGNPDMLMIRENLILELFDDEELGLEILKNVDASPKLIMSSIELKYSLKTKREILNALSQTAINGSWANENWLVYFESFVEFDEDCMDLAKASGIGIMQISLTEDKMYEINRLLPAKQNNTLKLNSKFNLHKKQLLEDIIVGIKTFNEEGSYMRQDGDYAKLSKLLLQAVENCTKQRNLVGTDLIQDLDKGLGKY